MNLLRLAFFSLFGLAYILAGVFVLKIRPISPVSVNTVLGVLFLAYGVFRIARQFFRAECFGDGQHLCGVFQRAVGLHVTQRPLGRERRLAGEPGHFTHPCKRIPGIPDDEIECCRGTGGRLEFSRIGA